MADFLVIQKRVLHTLGDWHIAALFTDIALWSRNYVTHQRNHNFIYPEGINPAEGWCYRSAEDFEKEWLLTRRPMERSRKYLVDNGYIETKRVGIPARSWYRLTAKGAALAWPEEAGLIRKFDSENSDCSKRTNNPERLVSDQTGLDNAINPDCTKRPIIHTEYKTEKETEESPLPPRGGNQTAEPLASDLNPEEKKPRIRVSNLELPSWLSRESWEDFVEHRKALRKPMTPKAGELILKKLQAIAAEHGELAAQESLLNSIAAGWQGVFPPKDAAPTAPTSTGGYVAVNDKNHNLINSWLEEENGNETNDRQSAANMGSKHGPSDSNRSAGSLAADLPGRTGRAVCSSTETAPARNTGEAVPDSWADLGLATEPATEHGVLFSN